MNASHASGVYTSGSPNQDDGNMQHSRTDISTWIQRIPGHLLMATIASVLLSPSFAFLGVILTALSSRPSFIRVHNATERDLEEVMVVTTAIGAIQAHSTSEYQQVPAVYAEPTVLTSERSGGFHNRRIINRSEGYESLRAGHYTVILALVGKELDVKVRRDR